MQEKNFFHSSCGKFRLVNSVSFLLRKNFTPLLCSWGRLSLHLVSVSLAKIRKKKPQ